MGILNLIDEVIVLAKKEIEIPIWEKYALTIEEAALYFRIGQKELREKTDEPNCDFVIFKGTHRLIKRKKMEEYLDNISTW